MTDATDYPRGFTALAVILIVFSVGVTAFWITFLTSGAVAMGDSQAYIEHEQSFPLADLYMIVCAITCSIGLFRRRPWALLFGLLAGSGIIFLGLMDILYSIQQNIFSFSTIQGVEAFVICGLLMILGPVTIIYLWRNKEYLLQA